MFFLNEYYFPKAECKGLQIAQKVCTFFHLIREFQHFAGNSQYGISDNLEAYDIFTQYVFYL